MIKNIKEFVVYALFSFMGAKAGITIGLGSIVGSIIGVALAFIIISLAKKYLKK